MTTSNVEFQVRSHYPQALPATAFRRKIVSWLEQELGLGLAHVLLATSVCADDIVFATDVAGVETRQPTRRLSGVFGMGGLAGLPFAGKTGMTAFAHHVPDDGAACIFYGSHIGMTDAGELGKVLRLGQHDESPACGALGVAIRHLQTPGYEPVLDHDDAQVALLEHRLMPYTAQILAAPNPMQAASEAVYTIIHDLIYRYVAEVKGQFTCERIALIGVVIINTSPEHEDYIDLRDAAVLRLADL